MKTMKETLLEWNNEDQAKSLREIYNITRNHIDQSYIDPEKCRLIWTIYELLDKYYKEQYK